jgi:hypothetical protein
VASTCAWREHPSDELVLSGYYERLATIVRKGYPASTDIARQTPGYHGLRPQDFRASKHLRWRATTAITWTWGWKRQQR